MVAHVTPRENIFRLFSPAKKGGPAPLPNCSSLDTSLAARYCKVAWPGLTEGGGVNWGRDELHYGISIFIVDVSLFDTYHK